MTVALRTFAICAFTFIHTGFDSHLGLRAQQISLSEGSASQDKQLPSVSGQVLGAATNEPLRKARVILRNQDDFDADPSIAVTDIEGRFSFTGILPARYDIEAERDGYDPQSNAENESAIHYRSWL